MSLPKRIRVEVKFTTYESVQVPHREREALISSKKDTIGLVAVLFWCGDRSVDGHWLFVDINNIVRESVSVTITLSKDTMRRSMASQSWLKDLNESISHNWPLLLQAFLEEALIGHEELFNELERCQREKSLSNHFPEYDVLETDHRDAISSIIEEHGESVAGQLFQDFFAHLLGLAGYQTIRINPVGIPDVDASDLHNSTGE